MHETGEGLLQNKPSPKHLYIKPVTHIWILIAAKKVTAAQSALFPSKDKTLLQYYYFS